MVEALGKTTVTTGGTPERICKNLSADIVARPVTAQSLLVQALPSNSGLVYVMCRETSPGDDRVARSYVMAILATPSSATQGPFASASFSIPNSRDAFDLRDIWIDADTNGDGAVVSFTHSRAERYRA